MKKILFSIFTSLLLLHFGISSVRAQACVDGDTGPCTGSGASENCQGASVACVNGECSYSYQCTNSCDNWGNWSPDPCNIGQQQTRFCISNTSLYQIRNCGSGGGGGGFDFQTCESGTTLMCGSPIVYRGNTQIPGCTFPGTCDSSFPSKAIENQCGDTNKIYCQDNCDCCPTGSTYEKTTITGGTYTVERSAYQTYPTQGSPSGVYGACNDWDDIYVSRTRSNTVSYVACINCDTDDDSCYPPRCRGGQSVNVYGDIVTCQTVTTTWNCEASCTTAAPDKPNLASPNSPSNGSTLYTSAVTLDWNGITNWGTKCPAPNANSYDVYVRANP